MKRSEWSDKQLEELLRQMPKIKDHRDPRDIYQNLPIKKRKYRQWLYPGIAAAAALLLFFILVPGLMGGNNYSSDSEKKSSATKDLGANEGEGIALSQDSAKSKANSLTGAGQVELMKAENVKTAIYDDEVGEGTVLTYWIPDPLGQILIPVSTVVTNPSKKPWLTLFNENMNNLKEEEWGLTDFYPLNATIKLDEKNKVIMVDVPADHQYGQGSTEETSFVHVLSKDVSSNSDYAKIMLSTNGHAGIDFGNYGSKTEIAVSAEKQHAFFFYYATGSELPFLVPSKETYKDVNAALDAMKNDQSILGLNSSLLSLQIKDTTSKDKILSVSLVSNSNLNDDQNTLLSYEALLMTAKEFGFEKVIITNPPLSKLGPFDLTKENKVPIAPNLRNLQ